MNETNPYSPPLPATTNAPAVGPRIQVRGHSSGLFLVLRIIAGLAVVAGIVLMGVDIAFSVMALVGILAVIAFEIYAYVLRSQRAWIEDLGNGFRYITPAMTREYRDEDVVGVTLERKIDNTQINNVRAVTKTSFWVDGETAPLSIEAWSSASQPDLAAPLVNRQIAGLTARMRTLIQQGGALRGTQWLLSRNYFESGRPGQEDRLDVNSIAACDIFGNQVCVWRIGQDHPTVKLPAASINAILLPALLQEMIPQREGQPAVGGGMGRVLFERKSHYWTGIALSVIFFIIAAGSLVGALQDPFVLWVTAVFVILGGVCAIWTVHAAHASFACHERGLRKTSFFGEQLLQYQDVARFTYSATRQYVNGAYTGTSINMNFEPVPGVAARAIHYFTNVRGSDDDLDALRDHIARVIAARLAKQLSDGQKVQWTSTLALAPEGIEYHPSGFLGRKPPVLLPYAQYAGYSIDQGTFHLFSRESQKSIFNEQISAPNFFPGFFLLQMMLHSSENES
jgi:hypothetical protein